MGLYLNREQIQLLTEAQRAMLGSLESPTFDDWRSRVNGSLRRLLGCDRTCFVFAAPGEAMCYTDDTDPYFMAVLQEAFNPANPDPPDAYWQQTNFTRVQNALAAWHESMFSDRKELERTRFHNEVHVPAGVRYMMGLSRYGSAGEATVSLGFERNDAPFYSEAGVQLLQLLVPAFEAGVQMQRRLQNGRQGTVSSLDLMSDGVLILGADGRELFRNQALAGLCDADPEALLSGMRQTARGLRHGGADIGTGQCRTMRSRHAVYQLTAAFLAPDIFGEGAVLVAARAVPFQTSVPQVAASKLPGAKEVQARFGLTRREAEVAVMMAEGLSSRAMSERMFVSINTARRHGEAVLKKLGVRSRSVVALKLLEN